MIKNAHLGKEIVVTVVNKIGVLADMSRILAQSGINIETVAGYALDDKTAKIMFISDDNLRAGDALKKAGYNSITEREAVIVELENKAGALKLVTERLAAAGIDIKQVYGTTCPGGCPAKMVLSTTDNAKALLVFKK